MHISQDGNYYLVIANCHPAPPNLSISATFHNVNPHGHLSARLYGLLPFYRRVFWILFPLTCLWTVHYFICYKYTLKAHGVLTVSLIAYLVDVYIQYYSLFTFNEEGTDVSVLAIILGVSLPAISQLCFHFFLIIVVLK